MVVKQEESWTSLRRVYCTKWLSLSFLKRYNATKIKLRNQISELRYSCMMSWLNVSQWWQILTQIFKKLLLRVSINTSSDFMVER